MATPLFQVRIGSEHHELLRLITGRLRDEPGFAAALRALYHGADDSAGAAVDSALPPVITDDRLAEIEQRLAALEAGQVKPRPAAPTRYLTRGRNQKAIPEDTLAEAQRLKDEGKPLRQILDILGLDKTEGGLKNALWKRRQAARDTP